MVNTNKLAYIFPGQGSQKVGMGQDLYADYDSARNIFYQADKKLGLPLSKLCFEGPEDELRQTINAQPALVTMSIACLEAARTVIPEYKFSTPAYVAGHSLGEYTALNVAGVLDFASTVYLARERGRLMQKAGKENPGGMAAIIGLEESAVIDLCKDTGTWLANINCPGQIVISGTKNNIEKAVAIAPERGATRALQLQVSGAFHSPLMKSAAEGLKTVIDQLDFKEPAMPIIANTTARPLMSSGDIKAELLAQLNNSVQWQRSVEYMLQEGVTTFIEIGSGKVLTGLIKRIDKDVKVLNVGESKELDNLANS